MSRAWMKSAPRATCPVCRRDVRRTTRGKVASHTASGYMICQGSGRPA